MKESARQALCSVQKLTGAICGKCPGAEPNRCCDLDFCTAVELGLKTVGKTFPRTDHPTLFFMGPQGCTVPPEYRPGCSGYVCPDQMEKQPRTLRREYQKLHGKFDQDPEVQQMLGAANRYLFRTRGPLKQGALDPFRKITGL